MKKARMNISHFRLILFNLKIFGEIVTTFIVLTVLLEACNEFAGHISASLPLRLQATLLLSKNVEAVASRWQPRVRFHPPKI